MIIKALYNVGETVINVKDEKEYTVYETRMDWTKPQRYYKITIHEDEDQKGWEEEEYLQVKH